MWAGGCVGLILDCTHSENKKPAFPKKHTHTHTHTHTQTHTHTHSGLLCMKHVSAGEKSDPSPLKDCKLILTSCTDGSLHYEHQLNSLREKCPWLSEYLSIGLSSVKHSSCMDSTSECRTCWLMSPSMKWRISTKLLVWVPQPSSAPIDTEWCWGPVTVEDGPGQSGLRSQEWCFSSIRVQSRSATRPVGSVGLGSATGQPSDCWLFMWWRCFSFWVNQVWCVDLLMVWSLWFSLNVREYLVRAG